jgi:hypothetical protein
MYQESGKCQGMAVAKGLSLGNLFYPCYNLNKINPGALVIRGGANQVL